MPDFDDGEGMSEGMWEHNVKLALSGKRGQQALRDLRDALLALPAPRLIANALCTVGLDPVAEAQREAAPNVLGHIFGSPEASTRYLESITGELTDLLATQGEGVCVVGAYIWWQHVKRGMTPEEAFAALPLLPDFESGAWATVEAGRKAGLTSTLAWVLAEHNDDVWSHATPEERHRLVLGWIERRLAGPPPFPGSEA